MMGMPFAGVRIFESREMIERVLHAKSPPRARRRERRGYPQHYIIRPQRKALSLPDGTLVMHPEMAAQLRAKLSTDPR